MSAPAPRTTRLATMRADGSRLKLHPLEAPGPWLTRRRVVFAALLAFYVLAPFVRIDGKPLLFLDVAQRRFWLFGASFNAQDLWLLLMLALAGGFGLLLVTAWRGRVWCGWACPQTVFLEAVFRPIERLFEGPATRRQKLQAAPWNIEKVLRVGGKHLTFVVLATAVAHAAAAIFVSPREFALMVLDGPRAHPQAFLLVTFFSAVLLFNFAWFREQFCVVLCPYGRLQSLLHDAHTVTVGYDALRGDPRGKVLKDQGATPRGDCVDCFKCVRVCPTGIDIRDGLQMECLACTQCIDACDEVMAKVHRAPGLIRFAAASELNRTPTRVLRPRLVVYASLFLVSATAFGAGLIRRAPLEANIIRQAGAIPFVVDGAVVRNVFEVHLTNKHADPARFHVSVSAEVPAEVVVGTPDVSLSALGDARVPIAVSIERSQLRAPVTLDVAIRDESTGQTHHTVTRFLSP